MASSRRTRRESDFDDIGRCDFADESEAVQGSVAAEESTAGRPTGSCLLTWLSGSVAEAGWTGGFTHAAVRVELVDDDVEVGQQQVGEVVAEAVAAP